MRRLRTKLIILLAVATLLLVGGVFVYLRYLGESNPHTPDAKHPAEVARIIKLLPDMPTSASPDDIEAMLMLPKPDFGSIGGRHCEIYWNIAPRYRFVLSFDPVWKERQLTLEFRSASIAAQGKPGFPLHEYHTVYPYRTWKGMVYSKR